MNNLNELKQLLQRISDIYQGAYGTWARNILGKGIESFPNLDPEKQREIGGVLIMLKNTPLTFLNDSEQEKFKELINELEQQYPILKPHQVLVQELEQLTQELQTERESTQQALQTSQEWHERQKREIIAEWKAKLNNLIQQRKTQIQQELNLLREILTNHHD